MSDDMSFEARSQGIAPTAGMLPQSLGIETKGGIFTTLITHGTPVPAKCSEIFTTADDNQPSIQIRVFQGKHKKATRNQRLGIFEVHGFALEPRGIPQIKIVFEVDAYGVLRVSAYDWHTERQLPVTVSEAITLLVTQPARRLYGG